jgi:hypothetical protein
MTYIKKELKPFFFFFENVKDFKLNYYVQNRNSKITKYLSKDTTGNGQFSRVFLRYRRSKMFPAGFIGVCSLGVRKVIFGGFDKK